MAGAGHRIDCYPLAPLERSMGESPTRSLDLTTVMGLHWMRKLETTLFILTVEICKELAGFLSQ